MAASASESKWCKCFPKQWCKCFPKGMNTVIIGGLTAFLPYWAFLTSLRSTDNFEPCTQERTCIYSQYFPRGRLQLRIFSGSFFDSVASDQELPWQMFRHEYIFNGLENPWLDEKNVSPLCEHMNKEEMKSLCSEDLIRSAQEARRADFVYEQTSSWVYQISVLAWASFRVLHDILVLKDIEFLWTMRISHLSTLCLFIACTASVTVAWNALELVPVIDPKGVDGHEHKGCACWYRFGFLTSMGAVATPVSLTLHFVTKLEDTFRAYLGGDYLITRKFHIPYRLTRSRKATGSMLGCSALVKDKDMDNIKKEDILQPRYVLTRHGTSILHWTSILDWIYTSGSRVLEWICGRLGLDLVNLGDRCNRHCPVLVRRRHCLPKSWPCHCFPKRSMSSWIMWISLLFLVMSWSVALPTIIIRSASLFGELLYTYIPGHTDHIQQYLLPRNASESSQMVRNGIFAWVIICIVVADLAFLIAMIKPHGYVFRKIWRRVQYVTVLPSLALIHDKFMWTDNVNAAASAKQLANAFKRCPEVANKDRITNLLDLKDPELIKLLDTALKESGYDKHAEQQDEGLKTLLLPNYAAGWNAS